MMVMLQRRRRVSNESNGAMASPTSILVIWILIGLLQSGVVAFVPSKNNRLRAQPVRLKETNALYDPPPPNNNEKPPLGLKRLSNEQRNVSTTNVLLLTEFAKDLRRLSVLRPAVPGADYSAPLALVSAGSSYTRIWTPETWKRHTSSYPHGRYFRHLWRWRFSTTAQKVFPAAIVAAVWACFVATIVQASPGSYLVKATKGASSALGVLSALLALLLTLRTNAALGRLNETRLAWGRLVLFSRSISALLRIYVLPAYPEAAILAARHVAIYPWLLKSSLRGEDRSREEEVMKVMLGEGPDYEWLATHPRPLWGVTVRLRQIVGAVAGSFKGEFLVPHNLLEEAIANMEGVAGVCERILGSPIPPTYSRHLSRALTIWLAMLPIGLVGSGIPVVATVFASAFTSYILIGIDEIGMEIEHPFSLLPMQQLAAAAQKGVGMQLIDNECSDGSIGDDVIAQLPEVPL